MPHTTVDSRADPFARKIMGEELIGEGGVTPRGLPGGVRIRVKVGSRVRVSGGGRVRVRVRVKERVRG